MKVQMTKGKYEALTRLSDEHGLVIATALDQRGSLKKSLTKALGHEADVKHVEEFKVAVTEELTPYSTAILLDPEFGWSAAEARDKQAGLLIAYEKTGYDATVQGRLPDLLPEWSVRRYADKGVDAIKILMYYDPDDAAHINDQKHAFIERIGAECKANDIPFFFEPVTYCDDIADAKGPEYAKVKPEKVKKSMREFTKPQYHLDCLKVEVPVNMTYVSGTAANRGHEAEAVYTREEALQHFRDTASIATVPFIYLSGGVSNEDFIETLEFAGEADVPFSGVLCGRATWQDGIAVYGENGDTGLRAWLKDEGVQRMEHLNRVLQQAAKPWWTVYGGKDQIVITES
ncbi:tagatose 1,6-diphosphate aldolase [Paenibacillus profundus]|uniref:Tagatose 1,6-diphosphate aldolase n=1 Tax=Paenibacillus profundus TaxID=1173085 RepID=A0ABS8YQ20_9BACL|nr:tagatose 1,6-diphosphate aldolase [Paenibacillus profundus]MCE5171684.1 tagatose 1,6-diphosphate aldolase [Paenibacillus profundus]